MSEGPYDKVPPLRESRARAAALGYNVDHKIIRARLVKDGPIVLAVEIMLSPATAEARARFIGQPDGARAILAHAPIDTSAAAAQNVQTNDAIDATAKALAVALKAHDETFERRPTP